MPDYEVAQALRTLARHGFKIHQSYLYVAENLSIPGKWWPVNNAPMWTDPNYISGIHCFDDIVEEGIGFTLPIPEYVNNMIINITHKGRSFARNSKVQIGLYKHEISCDSWSNRIDLINLDVISNNYRKDTVTKTLKSLDLTAGSICQFELTRNPKNVNDTLIGDWCLLSIKVDFS